MNTARRLRNLIAIATLMVSAVAPSIAAQGQESVTLLHVHGLGFSADGNELVIPSHHGLAVYREGRWSKAAGPQHDYMGFVATRRSYYTSGHPAHGSGLVNPFGLMRSDDNGKTWAKLGLEGESDFHVMGASFESHAIYVYNTQPNARMDRPGVWSTVNDGQTWRRAEALGLAGTVFALAVHPTDANTVAAGTSSGLFVSRDAGAHFRRALDNVQVPGVMFDATGTTVWVSAFDGSGRLLLVDWKNGTRNERGLPSLGQDAVAYIAQNPRDGRQIAIATFARSVYLSDDRGETWKQIADRGRTL